MEGSCCCNAEKSSPRPWGCFYFAIDTDGLILVFPTPASIKSSPRPWGCFRSDRRKLRTANVFPTPVGVFLIYDQWTYMQVCLPHARGGVSEEAGTIYRYVRSSPRPWGCFLTFQLSPRPCQVFPTPVGVFLPRAWRRNSLLSLPHARGGVSPWGCFPVTRFIPYHWKVFPTPVGVFF